MQKRDNVRTELRNHCGGWLAGTDSKSRPLERFGISYVEHPSSYDRVSSLSNVSLQMCNDSLFTVILPLLSSNSEPPQYKFCAKITVNFKFQYDWYSKLFQFDPESYHYCTCNYQRSDNRNDKGNLIIEILFYSNRKRQMNASRNCRQELKKLVPYFLSASSSLLVPFVHSKSVLWEKKSVSPPLSFSFICVRDQYSSHPFFLTQFQFHSLLIVTGQGPRLLNKKQRNTADGTPYAGIIK